MSNDPLMDKAAQLQKALESRHGPDVTQSMISAVGAMGFNNDALRQLVAGPNATADFEMLSQQSLLNIAQSGKPSDPNVRHAEEAYSAIRQYQREEYRAGKGRGR
jgi:hypothetical protein